MQSAFHRVVGQKTAGHETIAESGIVEGTVEPGFEPVADSFVENFTGLGDIGASLCIYHRGKPVVDLWGGAASTDPWQPYLSDSLQVVFSNTKSAVSLCTYLLSDRGLLDIAAPVAEYWPEFGAQGKGEIPVEWLLTHQAGLPNVDVSLSLDQVLAWDPITEALAAQVPYWEPGTAHGYHVLTFGWLVGEVIRRVTGLSVGEFFANEVAAPLGLEFWIGLPDELEPRVVELLNANPPAHEHDTVSPRVVEMYHRMLIKGPLGPRAMSLNGAFDTFTQRCNPFNLRKFRAAEVPACNGVTNARSLARMYASMVGEVEVPGQDKSVRLLSPENAELASTPRSIGTDLVLGMENCFSLGFSCHSDYPDLLGPGSFGYVGAGGSMGFSDPRSEVGFAYVMDQMRTGIIGDERAGALLKALRTCV